MVQKICKSCKAIYEGPHCPQCSSKESTDNYKGRINILQPEQSEIASHLKISKKGVFALKLG